VVIGQGLSTSGTNGYVPALKVGKQEAQLSPRDRAMRRVI